MLHLEGQFFKFINKKSRPSGVQTLLHKYYQSMNLCICVCPVYTFCGRLNLKVKKILLDSKHYCFSIILLSFLDFMSCKMNYSENYDEPQTEPLLPTKFTFHLKQLVVFTHPGGFSLSFVTSPGADFQNGGFLHVLHVKQKKLQFWLHTRHILLDLHNMASFKKILCAYATLNTRKKQQNRPFFF